MTEIKGRVELKGYSSICNDAENENCDKKSLTCCSSVPNIRINGVELHSFLCDAFGITDSLDEYPSDEEKSNTLAVRYIVLDNPPSDPYEDFEDLAAKVIVAKFDGSFNSEYASACYSEWTCGFGGYDFTATGTFTNSEDITRNSHNIFTEMLGYVGQWVYIKFN